MSFFPEEQPPEVEPEGSFIPEPEPQLTTRIPVNPEEVSSQLATAYPQTAPFENNFLSYMKEVNTNGTKKAYEKGWVEASKERFQDLENAIEAAAAANRAEYASVLAKEMAELDKEMQQPDASSLKQKETAATRALDEVTYQQANRITSLKTFNERRTAGGSAMALRNSLLEASAASDPTLMDHLKMLGGSLMSYSYIWRKNKAVSEITGKTYMPSDEWTAINDLRLHLQSLPTDEALAVVAKLKEQTYGLFGENNAARQAFFNQLLELTREESAVNMQLEATQLGFIADVGRMIFGLGRVLKNGTPYKVVANVGGQAPAGKMVAFDLMNGTKISGLTDREIIQNALSAGIDPLDANPALVKGMAAEARASLKQQWEATRQKLMDQMNSSGLTDEEIVAARDRFKKMYMPDGNPHIHHVVMGDVTADGADIVVYYQGRNGRRYATKEAAEEAAKNDFGFPAFRVTRIGIGENASSSIEQMIAFRGSRNTEWELTWNELGSGHGGSSIGSGLSTTLAYDVAERFAMKYGYGKGTITKIDIPEEKLFMGWYKKWTEQSKEVRDMLSKSLPDDVLEQARRENLTGQDLYVKMTDLNKGDPRKASKWFRDQGVMGNYAREAGPHGKNMDEFLLFNPKDAKVLGIEKVLKEDPHAYRSSTRYQELMNAIEETGDGDAIKAMMKEFGEDYGVDDVGGIDALPRRSVAVSKSNPKERIVLRDDVLTQKGVQFSASVDKPVQKIVKDWSKMLGLESRPILVMNDTDDLYSILKTADVEAIRKLEDIINNSNGVHVDFGNESLIVVNTRHSIPKTSDYVVTVAHELGHAFDKHILKNMPQEVKMEMYAGFKNWMAKNAKGDLMKFIHKFRSPHVEGIKADAGKFRHLGLSVEEAVDMQAFIGFDWDWHRSFGEFWAENFAKFLVGNGAPKNVFEKYMARAAKQMRDWVGLVMKYLGVNHLEVEPSIKKFLEEHIARVANADDPRNLDFTSGGIDQSIRVSGKPNIKLKEGAGTEAPPKPRIKLKLPEEDEWVIEVRHHEPIPYSVVGKFSEQDMKSMPFLAIDPKHSASEQAVEARVVGIHGEARAQHIYRDMVEPWVKPLSEGERKRVLSVLEEGDAFSDMGQMGKEWTYGELMGKGLSEAEANAYFAIRQTRNMLYFTRNRIMTDHLRAQGLKRITLADGTETVGRPKDLPIGSTIWDATEGKAVKVTEEMKGSKTMVELEQAVKMGGKWRKNFLIDDASGKVRDIFTAIGYRPGEFSRIYTDQYFIKMVVRREVDGVMTPPEELTVRTAASLREAQEFTDNVNKAVKVVSETTGPERHQELERLIGRYWNVEDFVKQYEAGEFDGFDHLFHHYTRNVNEYLNSSVNEAIQNGRLFTSKRSDRLFSVDATRPNTLGVYEALEAEITSVSRVANINQWRETMIRRWMNTFRDYIPNRTGDDVGDFLKASGASFTAGGRAEALFAERTHRYIMRQMGLLTQEERMWENLTRRLTEKFFTGNEKVEAIGAKIRDMSLLGFMRNINFNLTLGMFNPAQLIVQANGAATALILSPVHGLAAAKSAPLLRMALMSDNPDVWKFFAKAEKALFGSEEEFISTIKAIRQTGILDNLKSTSLYNLEDGKLNIFSSYPGHSAAKQHTFFFNRGEEFARMVSFDVARREWIAAHPGMDWTSKAALKDMIVRMDDLTQNMTKANLARFQEGVLSIPLQFAQYNIKLAANILSSFLGKGSGRGFTKPEALQLLVGHLALYGAAGNGLVWLVDEILPRDLKESMSVDQKMYISQGLLGGLLNQFGEWMTGERTAVAISSRLGALNYWQQLAEAIYTDKKGVIAAAMGPSLNTAKRLGVIGEVASLMMVDENRTAKDIAYGFAKITTEQVSTLRNAAKAYIYMTYNNKIINETGVPVAQITGPEVIAQALGFTSVAQEDVYRLIKTRAQYSEAMDDIAKTILKTQKMIMDARMRGDHAYAAEQMKVLGALWPTNVGDFMEVRRRLQERLFPYDTELNKMMGEYMMRSFTYEQPTVVSQPPRKVNETVK